MNMQDRNSDCCLFLEVGKCLEGRRGCAFWTLLGALFCALAHFTMKELRNKCQSFFCNRGCLGCCGKAQPIIAVDEPTKGLKIQGREVKKKSSLIISQEFWSSSSPHEMENSGGIQSQQSISSLSTLNQNPADALNSSASASGSNASSEFVNHGLIHWNELRGEWVGDHRKGQSQKTAAQEPRLSWNTTYESLLGTNKPFPQSISLNEMVEFLVDVWEQEGLYD